MPKKAKAKAATPARATRSNSASTKAASNKNPKTPLRQIQIGNDAKTPVTRQGSITQFFSAISSEKKKEGEKIEPKTKENKSGKASKTSKGGKANEAEPEDDEEISEESACESIGSIYIDEKSSSESSESPDDSDEDFQPPSRKGSAPKSSSSDTRKRKGRVIEDSAVEEDNEEHEPAPKKKSRQQRTPASATKQTLLKPLSATRKRAPRQPTKKAAKRNDEEEDADEQVPDELEPINKLADMFDDMVKRNPDFVAAIRQLNRPLRVATMCSGTESPLLALQLLSRALKARCNVDFAVDHVFSCEIEPFKQAYIERNFSPPLLFRDVRELGGDEATTAYGAKMPVPGEIDMLIAGTSCVDYSNLNNQKQSLDAKGESGETFRGMLKWVEKHRPPLVVLENVCSAPWDKIVKRFETIDYNARDVRADTKHFYIPHTRTRGYLLATPKCDTLDDGLVDEWAELVRSMRRFSSTPLEDYLIPTDDPRIHRAREDLAKTKDDLKRRGRLDWSRCQSRHSFQRLTEELGTGRPLTAWTEGGMSYLPDYAWNDWGRAQTDRVLDLMDINFIRLAKKGIDAQYKTLVWNLSQNVDRTTASVQPGICPCLTPSMIPYITNRGGPLVGLEALSLQGIPVDELLLTRETEDQLADLAGNAMTSTVVGTCMMAALTLGIAAVSEMHGKRSSSQRFSKLITASDTDLVERDRELALRVVGDELLDTSNLNLAATGKRSMEDILSLASESARHCVCEGRSSIAKHPIKKCRDCGHTACTSCGGRPEHSFKETKEVILAADRVPPQTFEQSLKDVLPVRLLLEGFSNEALLAAGEGLDIHQDTLLAWAKIVSESVEGVEFRFSTYRRQEVWTCTYISPRARLYLCLDPASPSWKLMVDPPFSAPKEVLRVLSRPAAKMPLGLGREDILSGEWQVYVPQRVEFDVTIVGADLVDSWEQRIGMDGPFKNKKVWREYKVSGSDERLERSIDGVYRLLNRCGTAMESLHRRIDSEKSPTFLFLDPTRCGDREIDPFVFASTCRRLEYGEDREAFAILDTTWRPNSEPGEQTLKCSSLGTLCQYPKARLQVPSAISDLIAPSISLPKSPEVFFTPLAKINASAELHGSCAASRCVVKVKVPAMDGSHDEIWPKNWNEVDLVREGHKVFEQLAWFTGKIALPSWLGDWMIMENGVEGVNAGPRTPCQRCAPAEPELLWVAKKNTKAFEGIEDPSQAAVYEQSLKNRPSPFVCQLTGEKPFGIFRLGINFASLIHRALSRLPSALYPEVKLAWRLTSTSDGNDSDNFRPFRLSTNKNDKPYKQPPHFSKFSLRPEQLRSLAWMVAQEEEDVEPFVEEEISEAALEHLGWRAEGRVTRNVKIRGGVIADQVGYGKTAITLGLIDETKGKQKIPKLSEVPGYIPLKATLVLVPGHLLNQWPDEIRKFLGNSIKVEVIKDMNSLNRLAIADLQAADIVVASSKLLSSVNYWENLEGISAAGRLPTNGKGGRYFLARYQEALRGLRTQTKTLVAGAGAAEVWKAMKVARDSQNAETVLELSKRLVGKSFQEEKDEKPKKTAKGKSAADSKKPKTLADPWRLTYDEVKKDWKRLRCPPFEMFHWNRVVVDEFTYLEDRIHSAVVNLSSTFRWVLSGTPPLKDFLDIKSIAVFLGVHLGVDDETDFHSAAAKRRRKEATKVEQFHSFREVHTQSWHARRHALAQSFLDRFVRQNVAEIDEIPFEESLVKIRLPPAERAIYLELEHHLSAMEMNSKKAIRSKKDGDGDRERRMMISLGSSATAEEALLKRCSHFDIEIVGGDGLRATRGKGKLLKKGGVGNKKRGKDSDSEEEDEEEEEEDVEESDGCSDDDGGAPARKIPTRRSAKPETKRLKTDEGKKVAAPSSPPAPDIAKASSGRLTALETCDAMVEVRQNQLDDCCTDLLRHIRGAHTFRQKVRGRRDFVDRLSTLSVGESSEDFEKWLMTVCSISADDEGDQEAKDILMKLIVHAGCSLPTKLGARVSHVENGVDVGLGLQTIVKPRIKFEKDSEDAGQKAAKAGKGTKVQKAKRGGAKKGKARRVVSDDESEESEKDLSEENEDDEDDDEAEMNDKEMASKDLDELLFEIREKTHVLRRLDRELIGRVRSLRFLLVVRNLLKADEKASIVKACSACCPGSVPKGSAAVKAGGKGDEKMEGAEGTDGAVFDFDRTTSCLSDDLGKRGGEVLRLRDVAILSCCGHIGCYSCMDHFAARNECPVPGCGVRSHDKAIVRASELGTVEEDEEAIAASIGSGERMDVDSDAGATVGTDETSTHSTTLTIHGGGRGDSQRVKVTTTHIAATISGAFGVKLLQLMKILSQVSERGEKALVFVQFTDLMEKVAEALEGEGIGYLQIRGTTHQKSSALQAFQQQDGVAGRAGIGKGAKSVGTGKGGHNVLLLHVMDESAAGANLTVANHVVFVGPLLAPSQEVYTAAETQAIGRARRYGQTRRVFIHRLITTRTIDEQIHEKRTDYIERVVAAM
ncbi:hypothetical protein HDU67_004137 [Dinochytrium kinnereticum]|nr:hypothetical protein HDU67_004137 [Dinochytrium kinnereticum]